MASSDDNNSPSFFGGLMAGLNGMANSLPTNGLFNMGMGLVDASRPFGNVGESLMKANAQTLNNQLGKQQLQTGQINQQLLAAQAPAMMDLYRRMPSLFNGSGQTTGPGPGIAAPTSSAPQVDPSNIQGLLSGAPSAPPQSAQQPPQYTPAMDPQRAVDFGTQMQLAGMRGGEAMTKYAENMTNAQKAVQTQNQMRTQGPLATLDTIATAPNADKIVSSDDQAMAMWRAAAPKLGLDPDKDLNPANARAAAIYHYNQLAGPAGLPIKSMPNPQQVYRGPLGQVTTKDPITNKIEEPIKEESLHPVIGPNGQPVLLPASQAAGKQPFNQSIFGASNMTDDTKEMAYQFAKVNGGKLPPWMNSRGDAAKSAMANYIATRAKAEGDTATSMVAQGQATQAAGAVLTDFTKGKTSQVLNGLNTSIAHMDALEPLATALGNGNMTLINKAQNFFKEQTGNPAPTNFTALKTFVSGEVAKAVLPGGGGEKEREELAAPLNKANSPAQLAGAIATIKTALAGKTEALRNQWDLGTNGTQGDFNKFLLPQTKKALGITDAPTDLAAAAAAELKKRGH